MLHENVNLRKCSQIDHHKQKAVFQSSDGNNQLS